jgi:hypothetical protein
MLCTVYRMATDTTTPDAWQLLASTTSGQQTAHRARRGACVLTVKLPNGTAPTDATFTEAWNTKLNTWKAAKR